MKIREKISGQWLVVAELLFFFCRSIVRRRKEDGELNLTTLLIFFKKSGYKAGVEFFLENYLLARYRLTEKLVLGRPSPTFFRKFSGHFSPSLLKRFASKVPTKTRILVMREGAMGDVIMLTPVVRQLYSLRKGDVSIDVMTAFGSVFKNSPYVNSIVPIKNSSGTIRSYDMVLDFNGLYERDLSLHPVISYAKHAFGNDSFSKKLDIFYNDVDKNFVKQCLKGIEGEYLVCHKPNHDWPNRNLSNDFWMDFLEELVKSTGKNIIQIGSLDDFAFKNAGKPMIYDHRGLYDLQKIASLIDMSCGFVGVDAGPSHIAASTDVPIFIFYTCAHHEARMPLRDLGVFTPITPDVECYGCLQKLTYPRPGYYCETGDNKCVNSFSVMKSVNLVKTGISKEIQS